MSTMYGEYHSFHDLGLHELYFLAQNPSVKTNYVKIPGRNGSLDLSESLGNGISYNDREITAEYAIRQEMDIAETEMRIARMIHGKRMRIRSDKYREYYFVGRVSVDRARMSGSIGKLTIKATCEPFMYKNELTVIELTAPCTVKIQNEFMQTVPTVENTGNITINGVSLAPGARKVHALTLEPGDNTFNITGSGMVTISYQQGRL